MNIINLQNICSQIPNGIEIYKCQSMCGTSLSSVFILSSYIWFLKWQSYDGKCLTVTKFELSNAENKIN